VIPSASPVTRRALQCLDAAQLRDLHQDLLTRLRDVEHWHRLVAARLDLAVAAVTDLDEPGNPSVAADGSGAGLHRLLGIPTCDGRLAESGLLVTLRQTMRDLDHLSVTLRGQSGLVAAELGHRRLHERPSRALPRPRRPAV
jgi:hypothetical protein